MQGEGSVGLPPPLSKVPPAFGSSLPWGGPLSAVSIDNFRKIERGPPPPSLWEDGKTLAGSHFFRRMLHKKRRNLLTLLY